MSLLGTESMDGSYAAFLQRVLAPVRLARGWSLTFLTRIRHFVHTGGLPAVRPNGSFRALMIRTSIVFGLVACGGTQDPGANLSYADNAREAYEVALDDFEDGDCLEAEPAFREVRREYPYSRYAALSELRVADCLTEQGKYVEAIAAYRRFVRGRPAHAEVPYARFKIAEAYFKQIPSDWLLSPPSYELDQGPTQEAVRQLRRFVLDYPDNENIERATEMSRQALSMLARHELYVAEYYLGEDQPDAAIGRLTTLLQAYEGSGIEPEAMILLGRVYLDKGDRRLARETFAQLRERYPRSGYAAQASEYLRELGER
jgi:outer membrane protein assembly factor BamD